MAAEHERKDMERKLANFVEMNAHGREEQLLL